MTVTQVSLCPTPAAQVAGRPALTPELLAASGARYSRSNEGLAAILSKIDPTNLDRSVDSIFKMVDYGHQSIADMAPVSMFIDGVSLWLAYLIWTQCPTAGGQESSTRYLRLTKEDLLSPEELGVPNSISEAWQDFMYDSLEAYSQAHTLWESIAESDPAATRIPHSVLADTSEKGQKKAARMKRNFAFDRARYFLPVALRTNLMLVMSARGWVQLIQFLSSHYLPEAQNLGAALAAELQLVTPRLLHHATSKPSFEAGIREEFEAVIHDCMRNLGPNSPTLEVFPPAGITADALSHSLAFHDNRYAYFGQALRRTSVRFSWPGVPIAEIRDLNRHRTGTKYCPVIPQSFYGALDQAPGHPQLQALCAGIGQRGVTDSKMWLRDELPEYVYWMNLGTELPFEHTTTANQFLYEAELRTGLGAHYKYAELMREMLELWYAKFPGTRGLVLEGVAEPE